MRIYSKRDKIIPFGNRKCKMAQRICFISKPNELTLFQELEVDFKFYPGFSISQKQKSIVSMHESILAINSKLNILEVSSKSTDKIGVELSAFKLKYLDEKAGREYPIENIFQSSKVFQNGGPFRDLLYVSPIEAKTDERLKHSGVLLFFQFDNKIWELEPKSLFYDWIYIKSLYRDRNLSKQILDYNAFTDIEFNHTKSLNCQARSAAIFVSLCKKGIIESVLENPSELGKYYKESEKDYKQISMFE